MSTGTTIGLSILALVIGLFIWHAIGNQKSRRNDPPMPRGGGREEDDGEGSADPEA